MRGKKIATLNQAIREAVPEVQKAVAAYPQVEILMRAIKFSDDASWHVGPDPVPIGDFVWPELETSGLTSTAKALRLLTEELSIERMPRRGLPPVCILISDGFCWIPAFSKNSSSISFSPSLTYVRNILVSRFPRIDCLTTDS